MKNDALVGAVNRALDAPLAECDRQALQARRVAVLSASTRPSHRLRYAAACVVVLASGWVGWQWSQTRLNDSALELALLSDDVPTDFLASPEVSTWLSESP
ncbi:hypothetical protein ACTSKR_03220 [Chitinibacteraceae bacterium HSL-7]